MSRAAKSGTVRFVSDDPAPNASSEQGWTVWIQRLTRVGWLSKGFVFVMIGIIAIRIASRDWHVDEAANQVGALRALAGRPFSALLIVAVSVGLVVFMLWNLAQALLPVSTDLDLWGVIRRIGWGGLGLFYGSVALAGLRLVASGGADESSGGSGGSGASGGSDPTELTARLLGATGGRAVALVIAGVVVVVAGFHAHKGVTYDFLDDIDTDDLAPTERRWLGRFGVGGFVARAFALLAVAFFLAKAAIEFDPDEAVGLDGALRELMMVSSGRWLAVVMGLGLVVAGLYDMVTFRRQRLH